MGVELGILTGDVAIRGAIRFSPVKISIDAKGKVLTPGAKLTYLGLNRAGAPDASATYQCRSCSRVIHHQLGLDRTHECRCPEGG